MRGTAGRRRRGRGLVLLLALLAGLGPLSALRAEETDYRIGPKDVLKVIVFGHDVNTVEESGDVIQRHLEVIFPAISRRIFALFPTWRYLRLGDGVLGAIERGLGLHKGVVVLLALRVVQRIRLLLAGG